MDTADIERLYATAPKTATEVMMREQGKTDRMQVYIDWAMRQQYRELERRMERMLRYGNARDACTCYGCRMGGGFQPRMADPTDPIHWTIPENRFYVGIDPAQTITGKHFDGVIIDDPLNMNKQETPAMKTAKMKAPKKDYNTIGVRFIYGTNLDKVYTYRIRKGAKVHLGQELIVPSNVAGMNSGVKQSVACVVEIHKTPQDTLPYDYKFVTGKVAPL